MCCETRVPPKKAPTQRPNLTHYQISPTALVNLPSHNCGLFEIHGCEHTPNPNHILSRPRSA
jgi:hypothetical protein